MVAGFGIAKAKTSLFARNMVQNADLDKWLANEFETFESGLIGRVAN
jgi:hypothetical protein